jgi:hypothetical protein
MKKGVVLLILAAIPLVIMFLYAFTLASESQVAFGWVILLYVLFCAVVGAVIVLVRLVMTRDSLATGVPWSMKLARLAVAFVFLFLLWGLGRIAVRYGFALDL